MSLSGINDELIACGFLNETIHTIELGKLAARHDWRSFGILRKIVAEAEQLASSGNKDLRELQARVEPTENHATLTALGFVQTGTTAHVG